jgi:outer membrane protein assembly factor BamB
MPYLGIFNESPSKDKNGLDFYLRLEDRSNHADYISLVAVDAFGEVVDDGHLLAINKTTGKVVFRTSVNPDLGFVLDDNGELMVD